MERHRIRGFVRPPTLEQVKELAAWCYLNLTDQEAREYQEIMAGALALSDRIDELPQPQFEVKYPRTPGYRPTPEEDPLNIFVTKVEVKGAPSGKLAGKRVAIKDNIALAGVPFSNGNWALADIMPDFDAIVVERLLDAGATIIGKFNQDDYSFFGTSDTSTWGQVRNPLNPDYSPGGSSSGQGASVRAGYADLALGVDQAGSGRIPAAWTGTCAIKATHGLVPSFGLYYLDHTLDFICPAARTVGEVAQALEVIGGTDPRDPQWVRGPVITDEYTKHLVADVSGMTIGVLKEGFGWDQSEPDVDEAVMAAVKQLETAGAKVKEVSVPLWRDNWAIWQNIFFPSISLMLESNGQGFFHNGNATPAFAKAFGDKRRIWADEQPPLLKAVQLVGMYLRRYRNNVHYAKAQNLRKMLTHQVDTALEEVDVLVVPGVIVKPTKLFPRPLTPSEWIAGEVPVVAGTATVAPVTHNTSATDITGHPSLVMPCGVGGSDNMPISAMFIGKQWHEGIVFRAAYTYETKILDLLQQLDHHAKAVMASLE